MSTPIVILLVLSAAVIGWLVASAFVRKRFTDQLADAQNQKSVAEGQVSALNAANTQLRADSDKVSAKADEDFKALRTVLSNEQAARVKAETELKEAGQRLAEERALIEDAQKKLSDTFQALAATSLSANNDAFMKLARTTLDKALTEAKGDLGAKEEAIKGLVTPIAETLKVFEEHVRGLESTRQQAYTSLEEHLKTLTASQDLLQKETGNLATALRAPQVRGRWGEMILERVVELAGMSEHCDFTRQASTETDGGRLRPDLVVHLPAGRKIVVDSKVSLEAYQRSVEAGSEAEREELLRVHANQIRTHMKALAGKSYWEQFSETPEFVVMFIPGESFFAEAAHRDLSLIEDGMINKVVIATPTTLIALMRAVAFGWRQEQIAENAKVISELGRTLHDRMRTLTEHIAGIGKGLERASLSYNEAAASLESRVLPAARRFKELGAASGTEIPLLEPLDTAQRQLTLLRRSDDPPDQNIL
jgi:DNA recombination protein RmuC